MPWRGCDPLVMRSPIRLLRGWYLVRDVNDPDEWAPCAREWVKVANERIDFLTNLNLRLEGHDERAGAGAAAGDAAGRVREWTEPGGRR